MRSHVPLRSQEHAADEEAGKRGRGDAVSASARQVLSWYLSRVRWQACGQAISRPSNSHGWKRLQGEGHDVYGGRGHMEQAAVIDPVDAVRDSCQPLGRRHELPASPPPPPFYTHQNATMMPKTMKSW